ncbi:hypothetical protein [Heyndrickxia acidicola]|uniref:Uncharacterized protein n=1 Tax=Heyndrickxia acidicola TaxID=209389 RepID=A0ABU6MB42_9BACI|nr:hypothetical protein [Heyndrickxia acidicola]MED1201893.1 hypothetical protein [Heyndrickxia acidicola]
MGKITNINITNIEHKKELMTNKNVFAHVVKGEPFEVFGTCEINGETKYFAVTFGEKDKNKSMEELKEMIGEQLLATV